MIFRTREEFIFMPDEHTEFLNKQEELSDAGISFKTEITTSMMVITIESRMISITKEGTDEHK